MTPTIMKIPLKADTWSEAEEGSDWEHSDEKFIHSLLNFSSIPPSCIFTKLKKEKDFLMSKSVLCLAHVGDVDQSKKFLYGFLLRTYIDLN